MYYERGCIKRGGVMREGVRTVNGRVTRRFIQESMKCRMGESMRR